MPRFSRLVQYPAITAPPIAATLAAPVPSLSTWYMPVQQPVYRRRSNLWPSGPWFFTTLDPRTMTKPAELVADWQPVSQPVRPKRFYWDTGGGVLVTSPTAIPTAENRLDAWFVPTAQPVQRKTLNPQGWWDGILHSGLIDPPPRVDHWEPHVSQPLIVRRPVQYPYHFAPQDTFTASVPSMTGWYRPASEPTRRAVRHHGAFTLVLPPSLLSTTTPCPYRPPFVEDTDPSAPTLAVEDEARPLTETEDELRPRTGDCC